MTKEARIYNGEKKSIQIGREVKLSLFADDMILYIENPKVSTTLFIELEQIILKFIWNHKRPELPKQS